MEKSFTKACMEHFDKLPGQTMLDFANEIRKVKGNPADYAYFVEGFRKIGVKIVETVRVI